MIRFFKWFGVDVFSSKRLQDIPDIDEWKIMFDKQRAVALSCKESAFVRLAKQGVTHLEEPDRPLANPAHGMLGDDVRSDPPSVT